MWGWWLACIETKPCGPEPDEREIPSTGGNLLVILLDDIGTEQLSIFGARDPSASTPTLECLCERGVRFYQTWATPVCSPSRAALMTGRLADAHGVGWNVEATGALPQSEVTIAELARSAGYSTGLVGKWHLDGWASASPLTGPILQGFDVFTGTPGNLQEVAAPPPKTGDLSQYDSYWRVVDGELVWTTRYATSVQIDDALDFMSSVPEPWLLVLSLNAAHLPKHEPPSSLLYHPLPEDPLDPELYRASIEAADRELSRLFSEMSPKTLARTSIFALADNGSAPFGVQPPGDPSVHKGTLYEGGVRVPMVVTGPYVSDPGGIVTSLAHITDIWPTFAEILGAPTEGMDLRGVSLLERTLDPLAPGPDYVQTMWGRGAPYDRAIRDDRYKLIVPGAGDTELYDLLADPSERNNLASQPLRGEDLSALVRLAAALDPADP